MLAFKNNFSEVEDILDNSLLERRLTTIQINDLTGIILYYRPYKNNRDYFYVTVLTTWLVKIGQKLPYTTGRTLNAKQYVAATIS